MTRSRNATPKIARPMRITDARPARMTRIARIATPRGRWKGAAEGDAMGRCNTESENKPSGGLARSPGTSKDRIEAAQLGAGGKANTTRPARPRDALPVRGCASEGSGGDSAGSPQTVAAAHGNLHRPRRRDRVPSNRQPRRHSLSCVRAGVPRVVRPDPLLQGCRERARGGEAGPPDELRHRRGHRHHPDLGGSEGPRERDRGGNPPHERAHPGRGGGWRREGSAPNPKPPDPGG